MTMAGAGTVYLYGDEGDDILWGANAANEYQWGGVGDDEINAGSDNLIVSLNGNQGDDVIRPGSGIMTSEEIRGGKGDDIINPLEIVFTMAGTVDPATFTDKAGLMTGASTYKWFGNDGDDIMFGRYQMQGAESSIYGGNGNDKIYGSYDPMNHTQLLAGEGG